MTGVFGVVRTFLLQDPAIAQRVGTRFYPVRIPQGVVTPAIAMQEIVAVGIHHLRGRSNIEKPIYQIDSWVKEAAGRSAYAESVALAAAIRTRLDGFQGVLYDAESPQNAYHVTALYNDEREFYESDASGGYFRKSTDYVIVYRPA